MSNMSTLSESLEHFYPYSGLMQELEKKNIYTALFPEDKTRALDILYEKGAGKPGALAPG